MRLYEGWFGQRQRQDKPVLGRYMKPPYTRTTIVRDVHVFSRRKNLGKKGDLNVNDAKRYVEYLRSRYPNLNVLRFEERFYEPEFLQVHFGDVLQKHRSHMAQNRREAEKVRIRLLKKSPSCQLCQFKLTPMLQVHHIVPLAEGGDSRLVTVACPNCHDIIHRLMTLHTLGTLQARQELQVFEWWAENQTEDNQWWWSAREKVLIVVNLYKDFLESINYDMFLGSYRRRRWLFSIATKADQLKLFKEVS